jgi:predicted nucleotidyltransferase
VDALDLTQAERQALQMLQQEITSHWPGAMFTIFGSRILKTADAESDLDLLIVLPQTVTTSIRRHIIHKVFELNLAFGCNISILLVSQDEWHNSALSITPIHATIASEGIPL